MDMEGALRTRLQNASPVAALLSTFAGSPAVFWVERPQKSTLNAITLLNVTDERTQNYTGFDGMQPGYVQVDAWATTYAQAKALKDAIIAALTPADTFYGVRFTRAFVIGRDLSERTETAFIFRPSLDFTFFYSPA